MASGDDSGGSHAECSANMMHYVTMSEEATGTV